MSLHGASKPAPIVSTTDEYVARWRTVSKEQDQILSEVLQKNLELEARVKALEYDNWRTRTQLDKYKAERQTLDEKRRVLKTEIEMMKSENDNFKNENPLIVCLLDGDGCIFAQDYLCQGQAGGFKAAEELSTEVTKYLRRLPERIPTGARIVTMVFLSKVGLEGALHRNGICTPEEFTSFLNGFGGAHQLFSIVDVGMGKEAADHKLREYLDMFTKMPQTFKVFFGGGHDNGYQGSLVALHTLGFKEKLVLLQSYTQTAREIGTLCLPTLEIPGLFMTNKLEKRSISKKPHPQTSPQKKRSNSQSKLPKKKVKPLVVPVAGTSVLPGVFVEEEDDDKEYQLPCMDHHMSDLGCQSSTCPFDHESDLSPEQRAQLKDMALSTPCRFTNNNLECSLKECNFGHECPRGPRCDLYGQGQCKFKGFGMHD